jgi:glutamate racemase
MFQANLAQSDSMPFEINRAPRILVFDSGLGGLSVLGEISKRQPAADIVYVADDVGFPYGAWAEGALVDHVSALMGDLIARFSPDLVVIACNTASTLVLPPLRQRFAIPFVGTVPAIKPAAEMTKSGLISVLATPGTVARDYTRQLIDTFASKAQVTLVGSTLLAGLAEAWIRGEVLSDDAIRAEIIPCFREVSGARTDTIVLGCTHYPLLLDLFRKVAPWDVHWIDGAAAIARRVGDLLPTGSGPSRGRIIFTSKAPIMPSLRDRLAVFGLSVCQSAICD